MVNLKTLAKKYLSLPYLIEKWKHEGFQRYFRNTGWMFFGRVSIMGITFLVNIYVARYLGPSEYGLLNYVISFVGLFSLISVLGVDPILLRELSHSPEKKHSLMGTAFILKIAGSLLAILLIVFAVFIGRFGSYEKALIIMYSISFIFSTFSVIDTFFQSSVLARKTVFIQILTTTLTTIFKLFLIKSNLGTGWFVLVYVIDSILLALSSIYIYVKSKEKITSWNYDKDIAKKLLSSSWPIVLAGFASFVYIKIDQIMIRFMLNNYELGVYAAATKLSEVWYFIPGMICSSIFPAIINAKKTNIHMYLKRLKTLYIFLIVISSVIALPVSLLSKFIISTIYGNDFMGATTSLSIYIWAGIPVFLFVGLTQYLIAENKTMKMLAVTSVGAIANIVLNIFMIPSLGISGAALASLISYSVVPLMLLAWKDTRPQITSLFKI
ncbi:MAG: flippase [Candidatus Taylorbacteria bacterium]|nr:flippase [Candidatus Taylorbacteria bacterium]